MNIIENNPHRKFNVGKNNSIEINHCADIYLEENEQITFKGENKSEYDIVKKDWGYYATPSINRRLKSFNIKTALTENSHGQIYVMLVEEEKLNKFEEYCQSERIKVLEWISEKD